MTTYVINLDLPGAVQSRHLYGHFAEHLGRCIYGGFWVGEDSDIPNERGIRSDVVEALRALNIPNLRWPGGVLPTNTTGKTALDHANNAHAWSTPTGGTSKKTTTSAPTNSWTSSNSWAPTPTSTATLGPEQYAK